MRLLSSKVTGFLYKSLFSHFIDFFNFSPHFADSNAANNTAAAPIGSASALSQQQQQSLQFKDFQIDVGKSLTQKLFFRLKGIFFNNSDLISQNAQFDSNNQLNYPPAGGRVGMEYSIGNNRRLEAYLNYKITDQLEPRPYTSDGLDQT